MTVTLPELDEAIVQAVLDSDNREVVQIETVPTDDKPDTHTRVVVQFANGSAAYVMVGQVRSGRQASAPHTVPPEVLS